MRKNIPGISFIARYWALLLATVFAGLLIDSDRLFAFIGAAIYAPGLWFLSISGALLVRHLLARRTTDTYRTSGDISEEWRKLTPFQRMLLFKIEWLVLFAVCAVSGAILIS